MYSADFHQTQILLLSEQGTLGYQVKKELLGYLELQGSLVLKAEQVGKKDLLTG